MSRGLPARDANWTSVSIRAAYANSDGTASTGFVTFEPTKPVLFNNFNYTAPVIVIVPLTDTGVMNVELPCTDDPLLDSNDWYYIVTENIPGIGRAPYMIQVTDGSTSVLGLTLRNLEDIPKVAL